MKFLAVAFAIILIVQLADVTADNKSFKDMMEAYEEQPNIDNNDIIIATGELLSLARMCFDSTCHWMCIGRGFRHGVCISNTICGCFN